MSNDDATRSRAAKQALDDAATLFHMLSPEQHVQPEIDAYNRLRMFIDDRLPAYTPRLRVSGGETSAPSGSSETRGGWPERQGGHAKCATCQGAAIVREPGRAAMRGWLPCPDCAGSGIVDATPDRVASETRADEVVEHLVTWGRSCTCSWCSRVRAAVGGRRR